MTAQPDLKWCFSTMGCPEASLTDACSLAAEFGIPAIELRSLVNTIELPQVFAGLGWTAEIVRDVCARHSVQLAAAGSSFKLINPSPAECAAFVDFCDWANSLGIPYVRVFGGGEWGTALTTEDYQNAVLNLRFWHEKKSRLGWSIELLLETHGAFAASEPCLQLNERLNEPINLLWDSHHTWRYAGEQPTETWQRLGQFVRHVHIKDSTDKPDEWLPYTYVYCGEGQMPLAETVQVLRANQFAGSVSLEWEKLWHPRMPPLRLALEGLRKQPWFQPSVIDDKNNLSTTHGC